MLILEQVKKGYDKCLINTDNVSSIYCSQTMITKNEVIDDKLKLNRALQYYIGFDSHRFVYDDESTRNNTYDRIIEALKNKVEFLDLNA